MSDRTFAFWVVYAYAVFVGMTVLWLWVMWVVVRDWYVAHRRKKLISEYWREP